jgi:hypothetical protein
LCVDVVEDRVRNGGAPGLANGAAACDVTARQADENLHEHIIRQMREGVHGEGGWMGEDRIGKGKSRVCSCHAVVEPLDT